MPTLKVEGRVGEERAVGVTDPIFTPATAAAPGTVSLQEVTAQTVRAVTDLHVSLQ